MVVISRHALRSNDDEGLAHIHCNILASILSGDFETRFLSKNDSFVMSHTPGSNELGY